MCGHLRNSSPLAASINCACLANELFSGERADGVYYGHANVRVPEVRRLGQIPLPFELKLFRITLYKQSSDPQKHFVLQGCALLSQEEWGEDDPLFR